MAHDLLPGERARWRCGPCPAAVLRSRMRQVLPGLTRESERITTEPVKAFWVQRRAIAKQNLSKTVLGLDPVVRQRVCVLNADSIAIKHPIDKPDVEQPIPGSHSYPLVAALPLMDFQTERQAVPDSISPNHETPLKWLIDLTDAGKEVVEILTEMNCGP